MTPEVWKCDRGLADDVGDLLSKTGAYVNLGEVAEMSARHQAGVRAVLLETSTSECMKLGCFGTSFGIKKDCRQARAAYPCVRCKALDLLASQRPAPEPEEDAR